MLNIVKPVIVDFFYLFASSNFASLQTAKERKNCDLDPLDFAEANALKSCGMKDDLFDGEDEIPVEDLLTSFSCDVDGKQEWHFKSLSGTWMSYEFLLGKDPCSVE